MSIRNLESLLAPHSVALIGASGREHSVGGTIARNLLAGGFKGAINFVNPRHGSLLGRPCYPSVAELPVAPALAIVATPAPTVSKIVADIAARGCRSVLVITAGLGSDAKQQILDAARPKLVRVLGPNSVGLLLPPLGLNASFAHRAALPGGLAFLSQSGALVTAVVDWASSRNIGFSHVVSLGDMADVDFGDLLDYLAGDAKSRAILLYMEAVTHAPKFLSAARRAARAKPVIVIKSGRHATAARAAASHTGRLAGSDAAYDAAFRRAGLLRVTALDELFEAAEILARAPKLQGERLLIVTNGGGAGVLAADHLADADGTLAELSPSCLAALDKLLPAAWSKGNPVDVIGDAGPERYAAALQTVLADPGCDAILAINCPTALASSTEIANRVVATYRSSRSNKPLVTNWLGDGAAEQARKLFADERVPSFETPGAAVRGFMQLVRHARAQDELLRTPPAIEDVSRTDFGTARGVIETVLAARRTILSEVESKALLHAYGIPVVPTVTAIDPGDASRAARVLLLDHPSVALKILSHDISHKSDVGGVRLDLATPEAVEEAANAMLTRVRAANPDAHIQGFTVSPMIERLKSHELLVGMSVDETFGPMIMFGAGGTAVEVIADTSLALPPLDLKLAHDLIARTRISRLLAGYRDRKPADIDAIALTLTRLSGLVCGHPEIREIDINPLLADSDGVIVLDARVVVADQTTSPRKAMAVKPYPADWEKLGSLAHVGRFLIRPIRPEDERLYETFLSQVTPADLRLRLFAPLKEFSHKFLARLTQVDYAREMAFVVVSQPSGDMLGVSRFIADPDYERAEFAVIVRSDIKGRGLGWMLMQQLIDYARSTGIAELFGSVLNENTGMLQMCGALGFVTTREADDPSVRHVVLRFPADARRQRPS